MRHRFLNLILMIVALAFSAIPAFADRDQVQFGSDIHVGQDETVHDIVCFFCNVDDRGTVEGDIVVFFGSVHIAGHANHDVVNFFGSVTADDDASVGQDMVSMFGTVRLGENVSIGKDLVAMFGDLETASSVSVGGDRVYEPAWIFWGPLVMLALAIFLVVREYRNYRRRVFLRNYPFPPRQ